MQETVSRRYLVREKKCQNGNTVVTMTTTNGKYQKIRKRHDKKKVSNKNKEIDDLELPEKEWDAVVEKNDWFPARVVEVQKDMPLSLRRQKVISTLKMFG